MISPKRASLPAVLLAVAALGIAGCDTMGTAPGITADSPVQPLTPVTTSTVATSSLPPLGGEQAPPPSAVEPSLSGTPVLGGDEPLPPPSSDETVALADPVVPSAPANLSGPLSVQGLAGGWSIAGNGTTCRLNLTNTAKEGTTRFRASTPGCQIAGLANVASWTLVGSQVQLYDEGGTLIAGLLQAGNRFTGVVAGGVAITMTA